MSARRTRILLVDDERDWLDLLREAFADEGFDVSTAASGWEALELVEHEAFDVVLSDLRLPGPNGIELLERIKEFAPDTEVAIVTAFSALDVALACLRGGAFDMVRKPVKPSTLIELARRADERRIQRTTAELQRLCEAITSNAAPERLLERIVVVVRDIMQADVVSLMLPDADGTLHVANAIGLSSASVDQPVAIGARVSGRVAQERTPVLLDGDLSSDPRFEGCGSRSIGSSIVYPLYMGERLVGVLNVRRSRDVRRFRPSDLDRMYLFAAQVLLALENARLVRETMLAERLASTRLLASTIAHEINNPASYLMSSLEHVRKELASAGIDRSSCEELFRALGDATEGAERISGIVADVGALGRWDDGGVVFDVALAVRLSLRIAGARIGSRARVTTELPDGLVVSGSIGRLSQILVNLLVNAASAFPSADTTRNQILVRGVREATTVVVEVRDNGPGIAATHLARLFEPWFTTRSAQGGTGLGLSIARDLARKLGGEIEVASAPGEGSSFFVRLPVASPSIQPPSKAGPRAQLGRAPRVLCIDDEPAILRAYDRTLRQHYELVFADGGTSAQRAILSDGPFDAIVCDLRMPDVSGDRLYAAIVERRPELARRFLFVTGSVDDARTEETLRGSGARILHKPTKLAALRQAIDAIVHLGVA
jgi:signal transduction histidine kinase/DNA-binding response OmpR family regulator